MLTQKKNRRGIALFLILSFLGIQMSPAVAGIVSTETLLAQEQIKVDKAQLKSMLERQDVQSQLAALGVDSADIEKRIANLTPDEVAQLNEHLSDMPAGGVSALGALLILFIVFVITDMIGATDILPFVHPVD
jgi:hypothetical protein